MSDSRQFNLELELSTTTDAELIAYLDREENLSEALAHLLRVGYATDKQARAEFLRIARSFTDD